MLFTYKKLLDFSISQAPLLIHYMHVGQILQHQKLLQHNFIHNLGIHCYGISFLDDISFPVDDNPGVITCACSDIHEEATQLLMSVWAAIGSN